MWDLTGKRAVVCGSTQGIGRAAAATLAEQGAAVTLVARNEAALQETAAGLSTDSGQSHAYVVADFTDPAAVRANVAEHIARTGPVHILMNNSGGPKSGPILDVDPEQLTNAYAMHVLCNHLLAQTVVPGMKELGYGRIINIISTSVKEPIPGLGVSNTTRWAVASWAKTLSRELAPFGITVNNVLPGYTDTERLGSLFAARAAREGGTQESVAKAAEQSVPMGRFAHPAEIAAAVAFLASPAASYISGINLPVDGARLASL